MTSVPMTEISTFDDFLAGSLVSLICVIGNILMILVIIGSYRIPTMKSSFGVLLINQNVAETVACVACFYVFFFGFTLNWGVVIDYSYLVGGTAVVMLHIILISFVMISFNRLCAIAFPIAYKFIQKLLVILLVGNWIAPFAFSMYLLVFRQCTFAIFHVGWTFNERKNDNCGPLLIIYISAQVIPIILTMLIDLTTLSLLLILRNRIFKLKSADTRRRELNFARQVLIQGVVFLMHGFWYEKGKNIMPEMSENWKIFLSTSFSSNLLHVFDPTIVFLCNMEFRTWLFGISKKKQLRRITTIGGLSTSMN